jgi:hypothetical protein
LKYFFSRNLVSKGAILGENGEGSGFASHGFFPLDFMMKHAPKMFSYLGVAHKIEPGVARFMDGVLLGDESKYDNGAMVMSAKDGLGMGLFFWGARNKYEDIRSQVPYLADEELASKVSVAVRRYLTEWKKV